MSGRERRIGERHELDARDLIWEPAGRRRKWRQKPEVARLVELSVSGAAIVAAPGVGIGELVGISVNGSTGVVKVRRVAAGGKTWARYGVEFVTLSDNLSTIVNNTVAAYAQGSEWQWAYAD